MIPTAAESDKIHRSCSTEDVSYTGTLTAPANQMATSLRVHS
jgi:hypothetical protein